MKEEIVKSFIEALKDTYGLDINEKELAEILKKEFFKGNEIKHPELKFILELLEKIDLEDFYEEG